MTRLCYKKPIATYIAYSIHNDITCEISQTFLQTFTLDFNFLYCTHDNDRMIETCNVRIIIKYFLCGEGPRSRSYGHTAALRLIVQPCDEEKYDQIFSFFQVMEHRWNEIDRGKPKYSGRNLSPCHFVHQKSHMDRPGIFFCLSGGFSPLIHFFCTI